MRSQRRVIALPKLQLSSIKLRLYCFPPVNLSDFTGLVDSRLRIDRVTVFSGVQRWYEDLLLKLVNVGMSSINVWLSVDIVIRRQIGRDV